MRNPVLHRSIWVLSVLLLAGVAIGISWMLLRRVPGTSPSPVDSMAPAVAPLDAGQEQIPLPVETPAPAVEPPAENAEAEAEAIRLNNLGIAEMEQFHFDKAAALFARGSEQRPGLMEARVNLGIALYYDRKREESTRVLNAVISRDPDQLQARYILTLIERETANNEVALRHLQHVLVHDPKDPTANYLAGSLQANMKELDRAVGHFEKALAADPWNTSVLYTLAKTLIQKGEREGAEKIMARFQELRKSGSGTSFGNLYLEQGRYARAMESPVERSDRHGLTSRPLFVETAESAGLSFTHSGPQSPPVDLTAIAAKGTFTAQEAASFGSGAAFFDFDGDGWPDLCLANASNAGDATPALYRNTRGGKFQRIDDAGLDFSGIGTGVAAGDYDNDGKTDLFLSGAGRNALFHNLGAGKFREATEILGAALTTETWALSAAFVDQDHDGDLDLLVVSPGKLSRSGGSDAGLTHFRFQAGRNLLFRSNGDGTFTETGSEAFGTVGQAAASLAAMDYNDSRDIDLLFAGANFGLLSNNRNGTFSDVKTPAGLRPSGHPWGVAAGDFDGNGLVDLCVPASGNEGRVELFWNEAGNFRRTELRAALPAEFRNAASLDYDNDGDLDILLIGETLALLENQGSGKFLDVSRSVGLDRIRAAHARSAAVADMDRDGDVDVLVTRSGGSPLLLRNEGGNRNRALRLVLEGKADNRLGIGAKIQWAAGGLWQHLEYTGSLGYLTQNSGDILLGTGRNASPDYVRVLWPTGVLQTEAPAKNTRRLELVELDRKGTSCPILYAWDGRQYRFVTDFLGGSATGYLVQPGRYATPDSDEYVRLSSDQLRPRGERLPMKMVNQLEEVILFDAVRLIAVDHPGDFEVFPNERLLTSPPFPEFRIITAAAARPVVHATDHRNRDWTGTLAALDRDYVTGFGLLPWKGYAEEHSLILDLGDTRHADRAILLLDGWIDYASSSSNFAAAQAGRKLIPPYLQVRDPRGEWNTILSDMGFPAGLPKTMVVDLTDRLPRSASTSIRIVTNMRIYWDRIRVDTGPGDPRVAMTALAPARASLEWVGYPRAWSPDGRAPLQYDYSLRDASAPWKYHAGAYTGYGDVQALLARVDEQYVVLAHGDGVSVEFPAGGLPGLPPGWTRDWLLYVVGFGKDMDLHSEHPDAVEPLPRHSDTGYSRAGWITSTARLWNDLRGLLTAISR